jgi:hypothetical protein
MYELNVLQVFRIKNIEWSLEKNVFLNSVSTIAT